MKDHRLGLFSGMGMVIANMIGAGVFLSTGYMAQDLAPQYILLAWIIGAFLALMGAKAYAGLARIVPHSGGEYRFLSTLVHPFLGYLAGWASLLIGFSGPIAVDAVAAGAFANTLDPWISREFFAAVLVIVLTGVHAIGLVGGSNAWPGWQPPNQSEGFPMSPFIQNLFYIAFAFSGWNAAVYAASEFKNAKRDVPKAMILGCSVVGLLYLLVNWVFVANLTPQQCKVVEIYEEARITLGHLIMKDLVGEVGAACMSVLAIIAFISAMSAMTFIGPRVYAAMAKDGFLPRILEGKEGKPPTGAVVLQGAIALFLIYAYQIPRVLNNIGAILTLFSALTVFSLFWVYFKRPSISKPTFMDLTAAFFYILLSGVMLYIGLKDSKSLNLWVGICILAAVIGYFIARKRAAARSGRIPIQEEAIQ